MDNLDDDDDVLAEDMLEALTDRESDSDSDGNDDSDAINVFTSRNGLRWHDTPLQGAMGREPALNIVHERPGPRRGIHPENEKEAFLMFTDEIIEEMVRFTNVEGRRQTRMLNRGAQQRKWIDTSRAEMEAFVGLHLILGAYKAHYRNIHELFSKRDGHPVCRAVMSKERFCLLKQVLRVDDKLRRDATDPLAPMGQVPTLLQSKLREFFVAGTHLTIDEQLMEFHGRVNFKQYIASKPGKFGIKIFLVCDAVTGYALNMLIYAGGKTLTEEERNGFDSFAHALVSKLTKPWHGSGRGISVDNWFTSIPLAEHLFHKKLTIIGTIRTNRKGIPIDATVTKGRAPKSVKFYYRPNMVLTSFRDKGTSNVLLLSSEHKIGNLVDGIPNVVTTYNATKSGVDNLDHMVRLYSSKRKCQRWPYEVLFNLLDIAAVNAYLIFHYSNENKRSNERYHFLLSLGYDLVKPHIAIRQAGFLTRDIREAMAWAGFDVPNIVEHQGNVKRGRCVMCPRSWDKKVNDRCSICLRFVCKDHGKSICMNCA